MFENLRRGRQARNFTTNVSKILDLKSSSEQIFFRKLSLGPPGNNPRYKKPSYSPVSGILMMASGRGTNHSHPTQLTCKTCSQAVFISMHCYFELKLDLVIKYIFQSKK